VRQRLPVLAPPQARAAVALFAGGHGGLQIQPDGTSRWGAGNFLVRTPQLFADQGLAVVLVDAPSDRQGEPFLGGFRQSPEHTADVKAVIAWLRAGPTCRCGGSQPVAAPGRWPMSPPSFRATRGLTASFSRRRS
jgi:dienelactone hydrolase